MGTFRRIVRKALLLLAAVTVFSLLYIVMYNTINTGKIFPKSPLYKNGIDYLYNFIPILVLTMSNYLVIFKLWRGAFVEKHLPVKIIADFIVGFAILVGVNMLYVVVATWLGVNPWVGWPGTILCNTLLILGLEVIYYIKRSKEAIQKAEYAKRELIQYKYDALKAQLNPHFLFNSLNIQLALILSDQKKAYDYTTALSNIYRYVLEIQNKETALLSEELGFLQDYASILEMRFNKQFSLVIEGEEICRTQQIVPFTMQLLVENAIKHNILSKEQPMTVRVSIGDTNVIVSNPINLKPGDPAEGSGIGHKYIAQQYKRHNKTFAISNDGINFTAIIPYL